MKTIIFFAAVLCVASAAKLDALTARNIGMVRSDIQAPAGAAYRTAFETENGIQVEEVGSAGSVGQTVVRGSYSWTAPNGEVIVVNYVSDENGYRAEGPSVPVWPAHALEQVRRAQEERPRN